MKEGNGDTSKRHHALPALNAPPAPSPHPHADGLSGSLHPPCTIMQAFTDPAPPCPRRRSAVSWRRIGATTRAPRWWGSRCATPRYLLLYSLTHAAPHHGTRLLTYCTDAAPQLTNLLTHLLTYLHTPRRTWRVLCSRASLSKRPRLLRPWPQTPRESHSSPHCVSTAGSASAYPAAAPTLSLGLNPNPKPLNPNLRPTP